MISRRLFAACAICGLTGFAASDANAETATAVGLKRTILKQTEGPTAEFVTLLVETSVEPGFVIAMHTHPGIESSYCVAGGGTLIVKDKPDLVASSGSTWLIDPYVPHSLKNGPVLTKIATTYVVEKGKPLATFV